MIQCWKNLFFSLNQRYINNKPSQKITKKFQNCQESSTLLHLHIHIFIGLIRSLMGKLTLKIEKYVFIKYLKMYHFLFGLIHLFNLHHCNKLCRLYPYRCYQRHQKAIFLGRRFLLLIENWQSRTCIVHYPMCRTHSEMINGQTKSKYQNSLNFTFFFAYSSHCTISFS